MHFSISMHLTCFWTGFPSAKVQSTETGTEAPFATGQEARSSFSKYCTTVLLYFLYVADVAHGAVCCCNAIHRPRVSQHEPLEPGISWNPWDLSWLCWDWTRVHLRQSKLHRPKRQCHPSRKKSRFQQARLRIFVYPFNPIQIPAMWQDASHVGTCEGDSAHWTNPNNATVGKTSWSDAQRQWTWESSLWLVKAPPSKRQSTQLKADLLVYLVWACTLIQSQVQPSTNYFWNVMEEARMNLLHTPELPFLAEWARL